jgi:outer membrane protein assembly factor BamD
MTFKSIIYKLLMTLSFFIIISGCSKDLEEYNKPAVYWYGKIIEMISDGNLEKADGYYSSLQSEHISSPLLPEATMILATAHMYYAEYLLSEHFLNEYIRRYATPSEREYAEFLKIKAKYMALPHPRRDQGLIDTAIREGESFKQRYSNSMYIPMIDTMVTRLNIARAGLNEGIADLYARLDKPKAAAYYHSLEKAPWINWDDIENANVAWYREWFEGDGTESWYGFIIPDTQSVVSRHAYDEAEQKEQEAHEVGQNRPNKL